MQPSPSNAMHWMIIKDSSRVPDAEICVFSFLICSCANLIQTNQFFRSNPSSVVVPVTFISITFHSFPPTQARARLLCRYLCDRKDLKYFQIQIRNILHSVQVTNSAPSALMLPPTTVPGQFLACLSERWRNFSQENSDYNLIS